VTRYILNQTVVFSGIYRIFSPVEAEQSNKRLRLSLRRFGQPTKDRLTNQRETTVNKGDDQLHPAESGMMQEGISIWMAWNQPYRGGTFFDSTFTGQHDDGEKKFSRQPSIT